MKKSVLFLLILSIWGANTVLGDSHTDDSADQIKKFENAVKFVSEKKYFEAVEEFKLLAGSGLPEAQFNLAILNLNGLGTPKNFKNALYWSWYAHLNGHETALDQVETIYKSITEALRQRGQSSDRRTLCHSQTMAINLQHSNLDKLILNLLCRLQIRLCLVINCPAYGLEDV